MVEDIISNATKEAKAQRQMQRDVVIALATNAMAALGHIFEISSALQGPLTAILLILLLRGLPDAVERKRH